MQLGLGWAPTFTKTGDVSEAGLEVLRKLLPWEMLEEVAPPGMANFKTSIDYAKSSQCGPDGVPYEAWSGDIDASSFVLFEANCHMLSGGFLGFDFNQKHAIFIRKDDLLDRPPRPSETRPLGPKDSAPKLITSTNAKRFSPALARSVAWIQRGFVAGRQFTSNIPDLDSLGRIMALKKMGARGHHGFWGLRCGVP